MLSFFRKKTVLPADLSAVRCDMHSHLIPGIDDGAVDLENSLQLIRGLYDLGYRKIITTPHIMWEMFRNTPEIIEKGLETVKVALARTDMQIEFSAAAEYFVDDHFSSLLAKDTPMLTLKNNMILVEFSFIRQPIDLKETLFNLQIKGYQPVIAHPERYLYFGAHKHWFDEMRDLGCLFQLNLLSLCGFYGKKQEELAQYLIRKKYVDLVGTDLHNIRHLQILNSSSTILDVIAKLLDSGMIQNPSL